MFAPRIDAFQWCRQHGAEPEKDEAALDERGEMRVGNAGRAPADQRRYRELTVRGWRRASQGAKNEEQEGRQSDQSLLAQDLEELVVRIARIVSPPPFDALPIGTVAVREAARSDPEYRVIADHAQRRRPEDGAIAERGRLRGLIGSLELAQRLPDAAANLPVRSQQQADTDQHPEAGKRLRAPRSAHQEGHDGDRHDDEGQVAAASPQYEHDVERQHRDRRGHDTPITEQ